MIFEFEESASQNARMKVVGVGGGGGNAVNRMIEEHLEGGVAVVEAQVGQGRLVLFGPQITFRAQPHGTFKLLFNGIVRAGVRE